MRRSCEKHGLFVFLALFAAHFMERRQKRALSNLWTKSRERGIMTVFPD